MNIAGRLNHSASFSEKSRLPQPASIGSAANNTIASLRRRPCTNPFILKNLKHATPDPENLRSTTQQRVCGISMTPSATADLIRKDP